MPRASIIKAAWHWGKRFNKFQKWMNEDCVVMASCSTTHKNELGIHFFLYLTEGGTKYQMTENQLHLKIHFGKSDTITGIGDVSDRPPDRLRFKNFWCPDRHDFRRGCVYKNQTGSPKSDFPYK